MWGLAELIADEVVEAALARVGTVLRDKWTLTALIGVGGMASVYAARHRNKSKVAIKMLHPELSIHAHLRTRFLREGYVANTVEHRGVVRVLDDDTSDDGSLFMVMELLQGESLRDRIERLGVLDPPEALQLSHQLLDTLTATHAEDIVHRDIKPANLFLNHDGVLKVLDFGIARLHESRDGMVTKTGDTLGTPAFMSPEQARGRWEEVDEQSDVWAVGATLFTLLTSEHVHEGSTPTEQLVMAVSDPAPKLASVDSEQDPCVCALVDRALARNKAERWPDAATMATAVAQAYRTLSGHELDGAPTAQPAAVGRTDASDSHDALAALGNQPTASSHEALSALGSQPTVAATTMGADPPSTTGAAATAQPRTLTATVRRSEPSLAGRPKRRWWALALGAGGLAVVALVLRFWSASPAEGTSPSAGTNKTTAAAATAVGPSSPVAAASPSSPLAEVPPHSGSATLATASAPTTSTKPAPWVRTAPPAASTTRGPTASAKPPPSADAWSRRK